MTPDDQAKGFWSAFCQGAEALRRAALAGQFVEVHLQVRKLLHEHGIQLAVELTTTGKEVILVFPPEWSFSQAEVIDQFLTFAPKLPGWQFHGRRQRKDWATAFAHSEAAFGVEAHDARFTVEMLDQGLSITMHTSVMDKLAPVHQESFVFHLLSHSLGDEALLDRICGATLVPPAPDLATLGPEEFSAAVVSYPPLIRW